MADKAESQGLGVISATVMVANCAIGAGVLSFPFVVRCCGVAVGAVLIVLGACILGGSLHILASASALSGGLTYQGVMRLVLPPRLANACGEMLEVTIFIYLLGVGAAFFNVIADQLMPLIAPTGSFVTASCVGGADSFGLPACRWTLITLYACVIELPLCCVPDLSLFKYSSSVAVVAIVYLTAIVLSYAVAKQADDWVWVNTEQPLLMFKAIPLVIFAFNCHLSYIPIFQRLHAAIRNVRSMDAVAAVAYTICLAAYLITGVAGYVAFGSDTPDDVLKRLPTTAYNATIAFSNVTCVGDAAASRPECCDRSASICPWDTAVARVGIALTVSTSYPILQYVARECLDDFLVHHGLAGPKRTRARWVGGAALYVCVTAGISIGLSSLTTILDIISTLFATLQVAALPALLTYYIYAPSPQPPPQALVTAAEDDTPPAADLAVPRPTTAAAATKRCGPTAPAEVVVSATSLNARLLDPGVVTSLAAESGAEGRNGSGGGGGGGGGGTSYFKRRAATMSALQLAGLPELSHRTASSVAAGYMLFSVAVAVLYYATIQVRVQD